MFYVTDSPQRYVGLSLGRWGPHSHMGQDQVESSKRIEQLCQQLLRETDPDKQAKLTAEIHRIVEESRRLRRDPLTTTETT